MQDPPPYFVAALVNQWRAEAEALRRRGAHAVADTLDTCVDEMCDQFVNYVSTPLPVRVAAQMSDKSESQIRRLVREGKIPNVGDEQILVPLFSVISRTWVQEQMKAASQRLGPAKGGEPEVYAERREQIIEDTVKRWSDVKPPPKPKRSKRRK